ncbi:MAG: asparaginase [Chromatiales bacterium]|nr:asparaginase [Chromatiales bacterium]
MPKTIIATQIFALNRAIKDDSLFIFENNSGALMDILVLNTGGTINKEYHPISGELKVASDSHIIENIFSVALRGNQTPKIKGLIYKDSLEFTDDDRTLLAKTLSAAPQEKVLVIHGTDTLHLSAQVVRDLGLKKRVIFTGAMVPFSIDTIEATANLFSAYGFLLAAEEHGVYVGLNGVIGTLEEIHKDRERGLFVKT